MFARNGTIGQTAAAECSGNASHLAFFLYTAGSATGHGLREIIVERENSQNPAFDAKEGARRVTISEPVSLKRFQAQS